MKILITDGMADEGLKIMRSHPELEVDLRKGLSKDELLEIIKDYDGLIIRSATKVTKEVMDAAGARLKIVGRAGIGVDNIDVKSATKKGIVVMNTPSANAITTAEHTIALLLSLARNIPQAHASLASGEWERERFKGTELFQKTLGIIGLGNIGKLVAERALGLGMKVIGYDPFISKEAAEKLGIGYVTLDELLGASDAITVHTPVNDETRNIISKDAIAKMKPGVLIINCARGGIVNEADVAEAIGAGQVAGAAFDVYATEPPPAQSPVFSQGDRIVHTPHLGASTKEAQTKVAQSMGEQMVDFFIHGMVRNAVNVPSVSHELLSVLSPYLYLSEKLGAVQGQLCKGGVSEISIEYSGEVTDYESQPLTVAVLKGFLGPIMDIPINHVNAQFIAQERGINIIESKSLSPGDFTSLITVIVKDEEGERSVSGTVFGKNELRIVNVFGYALDAVPEGCLLISENKDVPGVIGSLCVKLGELGINIARMHLGRESIGGRAIALINIDSPIPKDVMSRLTELPNIIKVTQVEL